MNEPGFHANVGRINMLADAKLFFLNIVYLDKQLVIIVDRAKTRLKL